MMSNERCFDSLFGYIDVSFMAQVCKDRDNGETFAVKVMVPATEPRRKRRQEMEWYIMRRLSEDKDRPASIVSASQTTSILYPLSFELTLLCVRSNTLKHMKKMKILSRAKRNQGYAMSWNTVKDQHFTRFSNITDLMIARR